MSSTPKPRNSRLTAGDTTAAWRAYASAPPEGTAVAALADLAEGASSLLVASPAGRFPLLVLRRGDRLTAYVNACPHQYLPLDFRGAAILSADGTRLICSSHGAEFLARSGEGVAGLGLGCRLDPVPLSIGGDAIVRIGNNL